MKRNIFHFSAISLGCTIFLCLFLASIAGALSDDFESLSASSGGTVLSGQDGYYLPSSSIDWNVYTYASNVLGLPSNLEGGNQFVAGNATNSGLARAQHDVDLTGNDLWTISYDFAAGRYPDDGDVLNYIGSFSLQPNDTARFIQEMEWYNTDNVSEGFNAFYFSFDDVGNLVEYRPGPAWDQLSPDHWYRAWTTFDLTSNMITEVGIIDLSTNSWSSFNPIAWYLGGGSVGGLPDPTAFRFYTGGGSETTPFGGNLLAFDNLNINMGNFTEPIPEPATMLLLGSGLVGLAGFRKKFKK